MTSVADLRGAGRSGDNALCSDAQDFMSLSSLVLVRQRQGQVGNGGQNVSFTEHCQILLTNYLQATSLYTDLEKKTERGQFSCPSYSTTFLNGQEIQSKGRHAWARLQVFSPSTRPVY